MQIICILFTGPRKIPLCPHLCISVFLSCFRLYLLFINTGENHRFLFKPNASIFKSSVFFLITVNVIISSSKTIHRFSLLLLQSALLSAIFNVNYDHGVHNNPFIFNVGLISIWVLITLSVDFKGSLRFDCLYLYIFQTVLLFHFHSLNQPTFFIWLSYKFFSLLVFIFTRVRCAC